MASVKFCPWRPASSPWRVYHRGRSYYLPTQKAAEAKVTALAGNRGAFTARELDEYRHALAVLNGVPLMEAVRGYMERQSGESAETVADVVKRYLAQLGGRPDYLEKKAYFLGKLTAATGPKRIGAVEPGDIEKAQAGIRSDWMKNDFLKHARILFRYAVRMKLTRNDPTQGMVEKKVTASKVILSLPDVDHLLATCASCTPAILPAIALQLFAGIRTSEICRLDWSAVKVGEFIDIATTVAKTHERRVIDWWPARLTQFMPAKREGSVVPHRKGYEHAKWELIALCRKAKPEFVWGQNAARHSFASYAVARWQDAGRVALWMGQRDVNVLFRHYRNYRTQAEGVAYFGQGGTTAVPRDKL